MVAAAGGRGRRPGKGTRARDPLQHRSTPAAGLATGSVKTEFGGKAQRSVCAAETAVFLLRAKPTPGA